MGEATITPPNPAPAPAPPVTPAPPKPAPLPADDQRYKDACQYAAGLSDKFLTLAVAGIAFIIGLVFAKEDSAAVQLSPTTMRIALVLFGISVLIGWLFFMNVVGSVASENDYKVYHNSKQWFCLLQILTALVAIALLAYCTFAAIGVRSHAEHSAGSSLFF
jgi:hypothetical protein